MTDAPPFGPTEQKILDILALLPNDSFVRAYVQMLGSAGDTHVAHHLVGALSVMSQLVPTYIGFPFGTNPIHANFFGLIVGGSGSRKTVAVSAAKKVLLHGNVPSAHGGQPASREAFIDSLTDDPKKFIAYSEFGDFLAASSGKSYLAPLRTSLNDAADCQPLTRERVRRRTREGDAEGGETGSFDPRVSVIGAVAQPFLDAHTTTDDWGGGFFARFFTSCYERERFVARPKTDGSALIERLGQYVAARHTEWCGPMSPIFGQCEDLTPEAAQVYDTWAEKMDTPATSHIAVGAATNRLGPLALKVALLLAWDIKAPRGEDTQRGIASGPAGTVVPGWRIDLITLAVAMKLVEEVHYASVKQIAGGLADTKEERLVVAVVRSLTFADKAGCGMSPGELSRELRRSHKEIEFALHTLMRRGDALERARPDSPVREWVLSRGSVNTLVNLDVERERRRLFTAGG